MKLLAPLSLVLLVVLGYAQQPFRPSERDKQQIQTKLKTLTEAVHSLHAAKVDDDLVVDVEVCQRAVENVLRFPEELVDQEQVVRTLMTLDRGLDRARQIKAGKPAWTQFKGRATRAYRSHIDGTPQPYRVVVPDAYDGSKPLPLHVYLHGKLEDKNFEVTWLSPPERPNMPTRALGFIQLQVFGRSNNGYHWAGETDVFEAIASVQKRYKIDPNRILLSGFSMGGIGAWHIGLHHPSEFAALDAGAGNTKSPRYAFLDRVPPVAQTTMRIYENMADYALNVFNLPTLGYGGETDPELRASANIREQLEREGFSFERQSYGWKARDLRVMFVIGAKTGHSMPPEESMKLMETFRAEGDARGRHTPNHIRFVTYTTRYNHSFWINLAGLQQHYQRSEVDARRDDSRANYTIRTKNVTRLLLNDVPGARRVTIDGDSVTFKPDDDLLFENAGGHWRSTQRDATVLKKRHGLQGPIDDAFMDSFLCVRPTGQPWNALADEHAKKELARFGHIFAKRFRGEARTKDDTAVTQADINDNNIVLFGDPGSNKLIARVLARLPIRWTKDSIMIGDRTYTAADHLPVLIYPNPLNPRRYVVINSGHTADERDYQHDRYYILPRLGDFAVLKIAKQPSGQLSSEVAEAGLFDEAWKLPSSH